jgi:dephospho-CoA kinase/inosine/xanthosine triphosphate pyrophosphatase family protein
MRELTFFTTNQTKLAHARYIAEGRQIRIQGFRQRTYHADYDEPRLQSRDAILRASYYSAKDQIRKAGYSEASHLFILEDTSVRIEALSTAGEDVPGPDVKYWMEGRTFESLDSMLRVAGNLRGATVRSDVLLHIPSSYRGIWGVDADFVVFTGEQRGAIVEKEHEFATNLVYPWLDNKSFNKWFRPEGCDGPFGSLPIVVADKVDFRRKSFEKLLDFLQGRSYLPVAQTQMWLPLERKPNIILCGYTCSGKTTASQHLARTFGYLHVEASDFMHLSYYYRHGYRGPTPIGAFAESALAQKPTMAAEKVVEYLLDNIMEPIVISGFRAPQELAFLQNEMATYGTNFTSHFIVADEQTRFGRLRARARHGDRLTIEEFRARDRQQERMGLELIRELPNMQMLENVGNLDFYLRRIDQLVGERERERIDPDAGFVSLAKTTDTGLQEAILIALLSVWQSDESRRYYTTTEISAIIARALPSVHPKHKDNVSRYFNQDYYAYFEISGSGGGARKYRLSNTGYGMAIRTFRALLRLQQWS